MKCAIRYLGLVVFALFAQISLAGQTCELHRPGALEVYKALELAQRTSQTLDESHAELAIVARAGQNLSKYGLRYSHLGFVWRDHPEGRWTVVHMLNQCGTESSELFNQGLGDFFMDDMYEHRTLIMIPSPEVQHQLVAMLAGHHERDLYTAQYNMLAYPFSTKYQNSNQWVLENYAAYSSGGNALASREMAQAWLRVHHYQPTTIHLSALERLGAETTRANVSFSDHPFSLRMDGQINTVTVDSMERFFRENDPALREYTVTLDGAAWAHASSDERDSPSRMDQTQPGVRN